MKAFGKLTKRRTLAALVALAMAFALLPQGASNWLRSGISPLLTPLGDPGMYLALAFRSHLGYLKSGKVVPQASPEDVSYYKGMAAYWKLQAEQQRSSLQTLLGFSELFGPSRDLPADLVPARVVGEDALPYGATALVNAGERSGVGQGQLVVLHDRSKAIQGSRLAVVTASMLVGEVVESSAFTARVRLVSDRAFKTSAHVFRVIEPRKPRTVMITSGSAASRQTLTAANNNLLPVEARGDGQGRLIVESAKAYDNILPGDLLITSGQSQLLPVGIRIGTVTAVEDDAEHPQRVRLTVVPEVDLQALRDVLIVVPLAESKAS